MKKRLILRALFYIVSMTLCAALLAWWLLSSSSSSQSGNAQSTSAPSYIRLFDPTAKIDEDREVLVFRMKNELKLSSDIVEALNNSVPLAFMMEYRLVDQARATWLDDAILGEDAYKLTLSYNPLLEQYIIERYLVSEPENFFTDNYPDLNSAMRYFVTAKTFPLVLNKPLNEATDNMQLVLQVRVHLDVEQLPAPLQPYAFASKHWDVDSDWVNWTIKL